MTGEVDREQVLTEDAPEQLWSIKLQLALIRPGVFKALGAQLGVFRLICPLPWYRTYHV